MMKQRDISIDILKFIACLAITNSHFDEIYGPLASLATGGAIGDALFFFASGFTIFLGGARSFDNYYKRRIGRIYPTVFAWALMTELIFNSSKTFIEVLIHGGSWFVTCIMVYYVFFYFIRKFLYQHLNELLICFIIFCMGLYFLWDKPERWNIYGATYYKWVYYFIYMLQGAIVGFMMKNKSISPTKPQREMPLLVLFIIVFYFFCSFKKSVSLNYLQIFSFIPLLGITYYVYKLCKTNYVLSLMNHTFVGSIIKFIGGMCLEIYICQIFLLNYEPLMNMVKKACPVGFLLMIIVIILVAYCLKCLSNIWMQTFKDGDYSWNAVFKIP